MKIGLIDVDGHNFPNLALMRISAYHKARGDHVEWWWSDFEHYDIVYKSKVFSDTYSKDVPDPLNADKIIKGGTGYQIHLVNGKEEYDKESDTKLPDEIEHMFPDYSIYPQFDFAVSMTSRGCPRGCSFCHVKSKEGCKSVKVANVSDFWNGQDRIKILDPNITACKDKYDLYQQYIDTGAMLDFTQGLDIRLITEKDMDYINQFKMGRPHFAWDNPQDDLKHKFEMFSKNFRRKTKIGTVYVLTNYNSTIEQDLYRIYTLRDLGFDPYVMIYNRPEADAIHRRLQSWCNNIKIFKKTESFEKYDLAIRRGNILEGQISF